MNIFLITALLIVSILFIFAIFILPWLENRQFNKAMEKMIANRERDKRKREFSRGIELEYQGKSRAERPSIAPQIITQNNGGFYALGTDPITNAILINQILGTIQQQTEVEPPTHKLISAEDPTQTIYPSSQDSAPSNDNTSSDSGSSFDSGSSDSGNSSSGDF